MITKGKKLFRRPCKRCEEMYQPTSKAQKLCPKCLKEKEVRFPHYD